MFDVGMSEVVVIGGVAILLLGKHDMPLVFRLVGRGVGKVSGLVQGGRARMTELSKGSDLLQLQNEIRSNLDDLRVIKAELRGAAQLPSGITRSSHPGTAGAGTGRNGTGLASGGNLAPVGASRVRSPADRLSPTASSGVMGGQASVGGGVRGGAGAGEMIPGRAIRVSGGGGVAPVGLGSAPLPPPPRRAVESVASPGGDRLQRLAMAEISFAEKELYAPKTGKAPYSIPGGADILNEAITDSLLQERYRRMLGVARGVDPSGGGGGGDASDDMGERRPST
ncbi:unnamed protein product [Pylaiella littoralis]